MQRLAWKNGRGPGSTDGKQPREARKGRERDPHWSPEDGWSFDLPTPGTVSWETCVVWSLGRCGHVLHQDRAGCGRLGGAPSQRFNAWVLTSQNRAQEPPSAEGYRP